MPTITYEVVIPDHLIEQARDLMDPSTTRAEAAESEYVRGQVELIAAVSKRSDNVDHEEVKALVFDLIMQRATIEQIVDAETDENEERGDLCMELRATGHHHAADEAGGMSIEDARALYDSLMAEPWVWRR